jgi:GT2 family glycosyltransferase
LLDPANQIFESSYEVIVTDDSRENVSKKLIEEKYSWAKWVEGSKKGPAANRNNGAKHATGEWLVFIDDDCLPDQHLLQQYKNAIMQYPNALAFEGAILPDDWRLLKKDLSQCPVNTNGNCFWSANICIKKTLFQQIKGFNENYLIAAHEDQQMKIDIENITKKKTIFLKECVVIHPVRFSTLSIQLKRIPVASKNFSIYAHKNKEILHCNSVTAFAFEQFGFHLKNSIRLIASGKLKSSFVSLAWLCYGVPLNCINFLRLRAKHSQKTNFSFI